MNLDDHGTWEASEGSWQFTASDFDSFEVVLTRDVHDDRLRAVLSFNYNHGPTGAVEITRQMLGESKEEFIHRVVSEFLIEHTSQDDCDRFIGQYSL